jgi:DNA-binding response OmpR family regulator
MNRVLIIEDNADMRETLHSYMSNEHFKVVSLGSCEEGIDAVDEQQFDICLVDINLPGKSGFDLIEYIRDQGQEMPVIALTARDSIEDKLKGFSNGANDYVVKPFNLEELVARMKVQLKTAGIHDDEEQISSPNYTITPSSMTFKYNKKEVQLTQLEFKLMYLLMRNQDTLVKLDDLIEYVWGEDESMASPPIRIHIANLRKKIHDSDYSVIKTIPGTGYIFKDKAN